jgi:cytochrome c oxidase subunit 2
MDLVPGSQSNMWFIPTELGTYEVACAEFCGTGHWAMRGEITVDEMADFEAWLSQHPTFVETMNEGSEGRGRQIVQSLGCVACHSDTGASGIGPTWRGSFGSQRTLVNGETMNIDEAYIKKSIVNPSIQIAAGFASIMPAYNLSEDELDAIVEYMKNLSIE